MRRSLIVAAMAVVAVPAVAFAQAPAAPAVGWISPFAVLVAGFGMALAAGLCAGAGEDGTRAERGECRTARAGTPPRRMIRGPARTGPQSRRRREPGSS